MRKILFLMLFIHCISESSFSQAVIRITAGTNMQTAVDNATAGTTFLIEPGSYGTINISKRVALIGPGYLLNSNASAGFANIVFDTGSDNSIMTGLAIAGNVHAGASGITIQRNQVGLEIFVGLVPGQYKNVGGTIIKQNFITRRLVICGSNNFPWATNTLVRNNIILGYIHCDVPANSGQSINNTILCYNGCNQVYGSEWTMSFVNNIIASTCNYTNYPDGLYSTNNTFTNNLIKTTQFNTNDASNIKIENFNTVFVGYPTNNGSTIDSRYQLLSNSPAKGTGTGGIDMGAFGGSEPYILQGIPIGPNVLSVTAPTGAAAGQTISVQIQAKVQN